METAAQREERLRKCRVRRRAAEIRLARVSANQSERLATEMEEATLVKLSANKSERLEQRAASNIMNCYKERRERRVSLRPI